MKKHLLLFTVIAFLLSLSACKKFSESIRRDILIKQDTILFKISPVDRQQSIIINDIPALTFNLDDTIKTKAQDFTSANIINVRMTNFNIKVIPLKNAAGRDSLDINNNIANFQSIKALIKSGGATDSLARVDILSETAQGTSNLNPITSTDANTLRARLTGSPLTYRLDIFAKKQTTDTIRAKMTITYAITLSKD